MSKHEEQIIAAAKGKIDGPIVAAAWGKPRGATTAAVGGGLIASEIGRKWASKQTKGAAELGISIGNPGAIAVTASDLITMKVKVGAMGGIKEITDVLSTVPLELIDSIEVKRMGMTGVMEIKAGEASFKLEGKAGDMKDFADKFASAKAAAAA